ncbi:MAG: NUDIX domain-containing protein [Nanoarchaeota archaeon]
MTVVDDADRPLRPARRAGVLRQGLLHRGCGIFIVRDSRLFVHKRPFTKDIFPGRWSVYVGGGVHWGEGYLSAARRELLEETGLKGRLRFLFKQRFTEKSDPFFGSFYLLLTGKEPAATREYVASKWMTRKEAMRQANLCPNSIHLLNRLPREVLP